MTTLSLETHNAMLDIAEPYLNDESIKSMQFFEYPPQTQANNNTPSHSIRIEINSDAIYTLPSKSYISIEGQIRRAGNNAAYDAADEITLINNAMMYLFDEINYKLNTTTIEQISNPGQTTSMIGYLSQPDDFSTSAGLKYCWSKDTNTTANSTKYVGSVAAPAAGYIPTEHPNFNQGFATRKGFLFSSNPRGSFTFIIPLSHIFGFAEYKKVIYGVKHTLTLSRAADTQALYRAAGVVDGKVDITNISWHMPQVEMNTENLVNLMQYIEQKVTIPIAFSARSCETTEVSENQNFNWRISVTGGAEKPRWIIIGFQTDKGNTQEQNPALFDHCNLTSAHVELNSRSYPSTVLDIDFDKNKYTKLYDMFDDFKKEYYGIDSLVGGTQVNVPAFKTLFPILVFDVRKQNDELKKGVMDITAKFKFSRNIPANTTAYALIISDRVFKMSSDGKNMSVISM